MKARNQRCRLAVFRNLSAASHTADRQILPRTFAQLV